jgi:hypothetical protein
VSLKSSLWRYLGLLAVAALAVGVFAGPASAKKLSAKQRAAVRAQLRKEIKKNPKAISRKSFVKRASLVDFTLPVTIKLRGASAATNPNQANIDLGASLGKRTLNLGGSLAAQIQFHDSYDGGALGNVDLKILPSSSKSLTSTSLPLLWNKQVSDPTTNWNSSLIGAPNEGCGDFINGTAPSTANGGVQDSVGFPNTAAPGVPFYPDLATAVAHGTPNGFLPEIPGVDGLDKLAASGVPGNDNVGSNPTPFPSGTVQNAAPGSGDYNPGYKDAVLRTGALALSVARPGVVTDSGVENTQNITIGQSGGQANLFGNIPGKAYGIDVTVSLSTKINSILRSVAPDAYPLISGANYPGAAFTCRQAWTGTVQNYIPGVKLKGSLHISPAITSSGLRIAKASLSSLGDPAHIGLAACLSPQAPYAADGDPAARVPTTTSHAMDTTTARPIDEVHARTAPTDACNTVQSQQVTNAGFSGVANPSDPAYTTSSNGSKVSVAGDISVQDIEADVLIGDVN